MAFFDPTRPAYRASPYAPLARLRAEEPVHWSAGLRSWVLTRYADCAEVLRDSPRFTMDPARTAGPRAEAILTHRGAATLGNASSLGTTSGAAHREIRRFVNPVFTPEASRGRGELVSEIATRMVAAVPVGEDVEFMATVANPLPRAVMADALGFPEDAAEHVRSLLTLIQVARSSPAGASLVLRTEAARTELATYFEQLTPGDVRPGSVAAALIDARLTTGMCTDDVISIAAHIATVGADPTSGAIANAVAALAEHPGTFAALRRQPDCLKGAVHELLRYDSPTHIAPRFAVVDVELGGRRIRRGDSLLAMVGAANRDPAAFERPDELDPARDARRQLGFGQGEHICLGAPLALVIMEAVLRALLARFERIELVRPPDYGPSVELRIPDRMVVRCT